jgi:hypothetical protein
MGGWMDLTAGLSTMEKKIILPLPGIEPWLSSPYPFAVSYFLSRCTKIIQIVPHIAGSERKY